VPETKRSRTRFDAYLKVYDRFNYELLTCDDPHAALIAQAWINAKSKIDAWSTDPANKISPSSMAAGMEQGLRETPMVIVRSLRASSSGDA
jgi:hypothetical protein